MNEDKEFNPEISIYSTVRPEAAEQAAGKLPVTRFKLLVTSSETPKRGCWFCPRRIRHMAEINCL